jgi:putative ABC transport system permease protein
METVLQDVRNACRLLVQKPGFTFIVVLTLALGIGANSAIFSFVNAVLLRPLPYKEADRLVRIESVRGTESGRISMLELQDLKEQVSAIESIAAYMPGARYNASGDGPPLEILSTLSTRNLFEVMGVQLLHGDTWPEEYDLQRNFGVAISYELWQERFGGDPHVIGQKITLDAAPFYTIFGILPPGFNFPSDARLFRSIAINDRVPNYKDRAARNVYAVARLKPGVNVEQARAELAAFSSRLEQAYPDINRGLSFSLVPLRDLYVGEVRPYLLLLLGAVAFVLLIACANVVNLLLSRALAREKEIAIRTALGAVRNRLVRQLLTESLLLALLGGLAGLALSYWWVSALGNLTHAQLPPWITVGIDFKVLAFTFLLSVLTGILAGLAPALQASRPDLNELLKEGTRGSSAGAPRQQFRRALVMAEIALALMLLVGAALMVQSFIRLQQVDLGFNANHLLTFRVALPWRKYQGEEGMPRIALFYRQALEKLATLPGVESVAATGNLPLSGEAENAKLTFTAEGQSQEEQQRNPYVNDLRVSPNYFQAMGIRLVRGRFLNEQDTTTTQRVTVISERLAERLWPGGEAIGKRVKVGGLDSRGHWMIIVGVVGNVKHEQMSGDGGLDLYASYLQVPDANMYLLLKTDVPPLTVTDAATRVIWAIDAEQATFDFMTMEARVTATVWQRRASGALFVVFAALALVLAAIGIYGVMSYAVRQRTREIGIRMALGASSRDVLRMVIAESMRLVLFGSIAGLVAAFGLSRIVASLLYGVSATDPLTFFGMPVLLALVALLAGLIPALRAARVDPMVALRHE